MEALAGLAGLPSLAFEGPLQISVTGGANWMVGFLTTAAILGIAALALNVQ